MSYIYLRSLFAVATLFALLAAPPVKGATIVEISGPNDENTAFTFLGNNLLVSFSTPVDYLNVSIEVSLIWLGGGASGAHLQLQDGQRYSGTSGPDRRGDGADPARVKTEATRLPHGFPLSNGLDVRSAPRRLNVEFREYGNTRSRRCSPSTRKLSSQTK